MNLQEKINFFSELITSSHPLMYWEYDADMNLLTEGHENDDIYETLFSISGCKEYLKQHLQPENSPLILADSNGLMWIAVFEIKNDAVNLIHMIGPAVIFEKIIYEYLESSACPVHFFLLSVWADAVFHNNGKEDFCQ